MTVEAPALVRPIGARYDRQFYTGMAIAAAVVVFIGFSPTFFLRANYESTPLPTYLIVHGVLFTAWIALFLAQTSLVAVRRANVHRRLGWVMAALAVVMVVVGTTAGIWSMRRQVDDGFVQEADAACHDRYSRCRCRATAVRVSADFDLELPPRDRRVSAVGDSLRRRLTAPCASGVRLGRSRADH
jgi:hypothetical protein